MTVVIFCKGPKGDLMALKRGSKNQIILGAFSALTSVPNMLKGGIIYLLPFFQMRGSPVN